MGKRAAAAYKATAASGRAGRAFTDLGLSPGLELSAGVELRLACRDARHRPPRAPAPRRAAAPGRSRRAPRGLWRSTDALRRQVTPVSASDRPTPCVQRHVAVLLVPRCPGPVPASVVTWLRKRESSVKIMLLCSAFNGLTQRVWTELRAAGHPVRVQLAGDAEAICAAVTDHQPDLIICPFLRERVPARIRRTHRTIIIHPGPPGDRGPSSLDWEIGDGEREWGVTALQAVEEMDAGPIWGSRMFPIDPTQPPRRSNLYTGPVADAAIELVHEIVAQGDRPDVCPDAAGLPPPRGARPAASGDVPVGPGVLLVRFHGHDPAADPGRRRIAGRAYHPGRDDGVGVRRPPRPCAPRPAGRHPAPLPGCGARLHRRREPLDRPCPHGGPGSAEVAGHDGAA
jgi:hypothetical protein